MSIPNILTWMRIVVVPVLVIVYYLPFEWSGMAAAILFVSAAITDALDGYLARQLGQTTVSGEFLDPVADKLLTAVALILIVDGVGQIFVSIAATTIIWREIAISALRQWVEGVQRLQPLRVSWMGKLKTALQMIAITLLLFSTSGDEAMRTPGVWLLYAAAVMSVVSMADYFRAYAKSARES